MVHILPTYWPDGMGCHVCERLLDRGWFRAGRQCYLPLHDRVCCVPYQFRVDALAFRAGLLFSCCPASDGVACGANY